MEVEAINEVTHLLDEFGDPNPRSSKTEFSGIIKIETAMELLELIEKFRYKIETNTN